MRCGMSGLQYCRSHNAQAICELVEAVCMLFIIAFLCYGGIAAGVWLPWRAAWASPHDYLSYEMGEYTKCKVAN